MADLVVTKANGIAFVDFAESEILDMAQSRSIGLKLMELVESKEAFDILVDFKRVRLITSSMIGELIRLRQKCEATDVDLKFCNMSTDLYNLLKKLKLDKSFDIYTSRDAALKAFQANRR